MTAPERRAGPRPVAVLGGLALSLLLATPLAAAPVGSGVALPTRLVQLATQAEETLLAAMKARDAKRMEALLGDDFQMHMAQRPAEPVPLEDWIDSVQAHPDAADYRVTAMTAREAGSAVVASFLLQPKAGQARPAVFIVDVWQPGSPDWRLLVRHASLTTGNPGAIPGNAKSAVLPKKF